MFLRVKRLIWIYGYWFLLSALIRASNRARALGRGSMTLFVAKISSNPMTVATGHLFGFEGFSCWTIIDGVDVATGVTVNVGSGCRVDAVGIVVPVGDEVRVRVGLGVCVAPIVGLGKLPAGKVDVGVLRGVLELVGVKVAVFVGVNV